MNDIHRPRSSPLAALSRALGPVLGPVLGLAAVLTLFTVLLAQNGQLGNFYSLRTVQVILHKNSLVAVCALGMLLIIVSRGIDLSVGSVVALVTVVSMQTFRLVRDGPERVLPAEWVQNGLSFSGTHSVVVASLACIAAGILVGGLCGLTNGLVITGLRVEPFVATLGMMSVARGLAYWLSGRTRLGFSDERPGWMLALRSVESSWGVFDPGVWLALLLTVLVAVLLRLTVFGRYCYAIGSNESTARLCGVPINRYKLGVYTLAGLLTGWAGVMMFAQIDSGDPSSANMLELEVIAAVVIGGASLSGGQGTVLGTLLGVLLLGVVETGVGYLNVAIEVKYILIGAIVVANVALSRWQQRRD
jgi:ribose transport system permease protein